MAGVSINMGIDDREVKTLLGVIKRRTKNLTPAMKLIGAIGRTSIVRNFEKGGRPDPWAPLSETTIARRGEGAKILRDKGFRGGLVQSIIYKAEANRVTIGTNRIYAAVQHFGAEKGEFGTRTVSIGAFFRRSKKGKRYKVRAHTRKMVFPWGDIPARPYLMIQDGDWPKMRASLLDFLLDRGRRK